MATRPHIPISGHDYPETNFCELAGFDQRAEILFNSDKDFDAEGRLKSDAPSHSLFIRHRP